MGVIKSCKGCADRYVGCHSHCERYQSEKAEYDRLMKAEKARQVMTIYDRLAERRRLGGFGYKRFW